MRRTLINVRYVVPVITLALALLLVGFTVGNEPREHQGTSCGSVLTVTDQGHRTAEALTRPECAPERAGGGYWLVTWGTLGLGALLLVGGWVAVGERPVRDDAARLLSSRSS